MSEDLDLSLYVHTNGCIPIDDMFNIVEELSIDEFTMLCRFPFLISSTIKKGILEEFAAVQNSTLNFDPADSQNQPEKDELFFMQLPIFPLKKLLNPESKKSTFSIGRHFDNDLVIADYTISRKHGLIKYENGDYFYQAYKSMNGSFIDNQLVKVDEWTLLPFGASLGLGRYVFDLVSAEELYIKLS